MIPCGFTCFHYISHVFYSGFKFKSYSWIKWYLVLIPIVIDEYAIWYKTSIILF